MLLLTLDGTGLVDFEKLEVGGIEMNSIHTVGIAHYAILAGTKHQTCNRESISRPYDTKEEAIAALAQFAYNPKPDHFYREYLLYKEEQARREAEQAIVYKRDDYDAA